MTIKDSPVISHENPSVPPSFWPVPFSGRLAALASKELEAWSPSQLPGRLLGVGREPVTGNSLPGEAHRESPGGLHRYTPLRKMKER